MTVTVQEQRARVSYLLTVTGVDGYVELFRWTLGSTVEAGAGVALPQTVLDLLGRRIATLTEGVPANALPDLTQIVSLVANVRDLQGQAVGSVNVQDGYHALEVGELVAGQTYYLILSIPHAVGAPSC